MIVCWNGVQSIGERAMNIGSKPVEKRFLDRCDAKSDPATRKPEFKDSKSSVSIDFDANHGLHVPDKPAACRLFGRLGPWVGAGSEERMS